MTDTVSPTAILIAINRGAMLDRRGSAETFDRQIAFVFSLNPTDAELVAAAQEATEDKDPHLKNILKVIERVRAVVAHAARMPGDRWAPAEARPFV